MSLNINNRSPIKDINQFKNELENSKEFYPDVLIPKKADAALQKYLKPQDKTPVTPLKGRVTNAKEVLKDSSHKQNLSPIALRLINKEIAKAEGISRESIEKLSPDMYKLYENAFGGGRFGKNTGLKILGPESIRDNTILMKNFGVLSTDPLIKQELKAFFDDLEKTLPSKEESLSLKGAVLAEKSWNIPKNDAAMLGAIHAGQTFMIHSHVESIQGSSVKKENGSNALSQILREEDIFDAQKQRPRVLGREIIALLHSGYHRLKHPYENVLGLVFVCSDEALAKSLSLRKINEEASKVNDAQEIYKLIENRTVQVVAPIAPIKLDF